MRKKLPVNAQKDVLLRSRRRCCLCLGLHFDLSIKNVQIAHLDRDADNNAADNLVALCLDHHDEYDTTRRQTKKITKAIGEVKKAILKGTRDIPIRQPATSHG